jgi:hypothetical protein
MCASRIIALRKVMVVHNMPREFETAGFSFVAKLLPKDFARIAVETID